MLFTQVRKWIFGEECLTLRMSASIPLQTRHWFVPVESKRRGYSIRVTPRKIVIKRKNFIRLIAGFPSAYRFVGRLSRLYREGDTVSVPGIVTTEPFQKIFLSIWLAIVFFVLTTTLGWAVFLAMKTMLSLDLIPIDDLAAAGFMLGAGILTLMGGAVIVAVMRAISWGERRRLIEFCAHAGGLGPTNTRTAERMGRGA